MIPFLLNLFVALGTILWPTSDWDFALARTTAFLLKKGMTEAEVSRVLGGTIYSVRMNSLGGFAVYPEYRLRVDFSYVGGGLTSARYVRIKALPGEGRRFRYLQELPLD
jgi:hypothetical protein